MIRTKRIAPISRHAPGVSAVRAMWRLRWVATLSVSLLLTLAGCMLLHSHRRRGSTPSSSRRTTRSRVTLPARSRS